MMNICFATNYLPGYHKTWGGAEQACRMVLGLLVEKGQHVDVLTTKPVSYPQSDQGFSLFPAPVLEDYSLTKVLANLKKAVPFDLVSYPTTFKVLKKIQPDILHLHNFDVLSLSVIASAKRLGIPIILSVYDYWPVCPRRILFKGKGEVCREFHGPLCADCLGLGKGSCLRRLSLRFRKSFFDAYIGKVDAFIVLSESSAKILEEYGLDRKKINVIPLPLWKKIEFDKGGGLEENTILFVGWLYPHKGLHVLLRAMPRVLEKMPSAKLYVVETGRGEAYAEEVEELIRELKLKKHVVMLGKVSHREVEKLLRKTSVVAIPEQWENMLPLILGEAMILAKPIVASCIGGIPELIKNTQTGLLATPDDSGDFAKKIVWLLQNKEKAREMGERAQKAASQIFSEEKFLDDLLGLYKKHIS